jgi:hypothetical protein
MNMKKYLLLICLFPLLGNTVLPRFSITLENAVFDCSKSFYNLNYDVVLQNNTADTLWLLKPFHNYIKNIKQLPWTFVYENDSLCTENDYNHYAVADPHEPREEILQMKDFIKVLPGEKLVYHEKDASYDVCKRKDNNSYITLSYQPIITDQPKLSRSERARIKSLLKNINKTIQLTEAEIEDDNQDRHRYEKKPATESNKIKLKNFENHMYGLKSLQRELTAYQSSFDLYNKIVQEQIVSNMLQIVKR